MESGKKRVFICGLHEESNSFNPCLADFNEFKSYCLYEGSDVLNPDARSGVTASGVIHALLEEEIECVAGVVMSTMSNGPVEHSIVEWFLEKNETALKNIGKVDGIVCVLHGATTSEKSDDVCGDVLEKLRQIVGEDVVIGASFDLHANITEKVMKNADYVCGYQTYPHLDHYGVGYRAAKFVAMDLKGRKAKTVRSVVPVIAPAHGYTTTKGGLKKLMDRATEMVKSGKILDYTIFQVQPWLDVPEMASAVVVIAENEETAKVVAKDLANEEFELRFELQGSPLITIPEVIEKALENKTGKPVVLVDSADSPNAGATSDSAKVIEELLPYSDKLKCAVAVTDPVAVKQAFELGVGGIADFTLGATLAPKLTKPVLVKNATVKSLHDGIFYMHGPQERGMRRNVGKTAVLTVGKIMIHVCTRGLCEGDMNFYRSFGINPDMCDLVSVKACTSFRAGYEPIAAEIYNTETPGAAGPVLTDLPFEKRPKPLFPFEEVSESMISEPKCYR